MNIHTHTVKSKEKLDSYHGTVSAARAWVTIFTFRPHDNDMGQVVWANQSHIWCPTSDYLTPEVWHHGDSKLITQQQTSSCCEDKGLAFACFSLLFEPEITEKKGISLERTNLLRKQRIGALPLIKDLESLQEKRPLSKRPIDGPLPMCHCYLFFAGGGLCVWEILYYLYVDRVCLAYQVRLSLSPSYIVAG